MIKFTPTMDPHSEHVYRRKSQNPEMDWDLIGMILWHPGKEARYKFLPDEDELTLSEMAKIVERLQKIKVQTALRAELKRLGDQ